MNWTLKYFWKFEVWSLRHHSTHIHPHIYVLMRIRYLKIFHKSMQNEPQKDLRSEWNGPHITIINKRPIEYSVYFHFKINTFRNRFEKLKMTEKQHKLFIEFSFRKGGTKVFVAFQLDFLRDFVGICFLLRIDRTISFHVTIYR